MSDDYARWVLAPPLPTRPVPATSSYFLCGVPRSGTWLLAGLLESTGVAGHPHEYFWRDTEAANRRAWGVSSFSEYVSRVKEVGTSADGVFGAKVMWGSLPGLVEELRALSPTAGIGDRELVELFFPRPRFVHVWRENVAAQAVSWAKAIQTGRWHHWDPPAADVRPRFDFTEVDALVHEVEEHDAAWRRWFSENEVDAFRVRYEDLVEDMDTVTRELLSFLEVAVPPDLAVSPRTANAADALNEDWIARYLTLRDG